jgi:hypothetical protein
LVSVLILLPRTARSAVPLRPTRAQNSAA